MLILLLNVLIIVLCLWCLTRVFDFMMLAIVNVFDAIGFFKR